MARTLEIVGPRIAVRRSDGATETTAGGLFIPETARELSQEGEVVTVSDRFNYLGLAAGDKVLFGKYAGVDVKLDGESLLILREEELLAVIRG